MQQNQTPEQQAELNKQYERYIELLTKVNGISAQSARIKANAARDAGDLVKEVKRLEEIETELVNKASYLFDTFRETTAELKNQNLILDAGKSTFKSLTSIAEDFNYQQRGISDLSERDLKRSAQKIAQSEAELVNVRNKLSLDGITYNRQAQLNNLVALSNQEGVKLTKNQEALLGQLTKEKELLDAANNALEEGIPLLNEELKISKQIYKTRTELNGVAGAAASILEKFGGNLASFLDISEAKEEVEKFNKKLVDDALKSSAVLEQMRQIDKDRIAILDSSVNIQRDIADIQNQINAAIEAGSKKIELENEKLRLQENIQNNINEAVEINVKNAAKRVELQELNNRLNALGTEAVEDRLIIEQQIANINREISEGQSRQVEINLRNSGYRANIRQIDQDILDQTREADKLSDLELKKQQKKQDLLDNEKKTEQDLIELDKKEAAVKTAAIASVNTLGNKFQSLGVFISNAAGGVKKLFTDPITLMTTLVELGFKANGQVVELGKSFGISAKAAENIRQDVAAFSRSTGDTFINTDRLLKAQSELSKEMGIAVKFSNEELATFAKLTELTGLSAQEAGKLAGAAAAAGVSTEAYTDGIREGAFSAMQATNTHFEMKEVMQDISKLSAGTLIKFQGNPKALAATVVEAKKLGLTLEQVNKTGESLLNFESSIESELKAELMTGKQLNLERARAAALSNDQAALTKEIGDQVGTLNDYQNMNVLAQQSLAEAFGMSRDEMSEMLMKQEAINQYGEEAGQLNKEQLEEMKRKGLSASEYIQQQEQQRKAQDKFNDAMTKLQDIIGNLVAGPVGQLLDALSNMVGVAMKILSPLSFVFNIIARITEGISDFVSTPFGGIIAGLTGIYLLSGKIASGLGSMGKGIMDFGKGIMSSFKGGSEGGGGFLSRIKKSFKGGLTGGDKTAEVAETGTKGAETTSSTAGKSEAGGDGSKFKTKMQNIADGIKAFADKDVLKGAIYLIPASIGLLLFAPGVLGIKAIEQVKGEKFQEAMYGIAYGIADFGKNVTFGALAKLALGGIALTAFALGVPGILFLQLVNGDKFRSSMEGIGAGISSFGEKTTMSALGKLALGGIALTAFALGVPGILFIQLVKGEKFQSSMEGIGLGIASFSEKVSAGALVKLLFGGIALAAFTVAVPALLLLQFVNGSSIEKALTGVGKGIKGFSENVSYGDLIKGAVAIALLGASLIPFTYAVGLMGDIDPATILIGVGALGALAGIAYLVSKASKDMIVGSIAIAILGAALIPFAYALSLLAEVKMENVLAAGAGLLIFGAAVLGLGLLMTSGVGAFIFGAGILAMIALGGAMMILGAGLKVVSEGGAGIATLFQQLSELDATKLDAVAPALKTIGEAVLFLGAGAVLGAIGKLLGGDSPSKMIQDIAASSKDIAQVSSSFQILSNSFKELSSIDASKIEPVILLFDKIKEGLIALDEVGKDKLKIFKSIIDSITPLFSLIEKIDEKKLTALSNIANSIVSMFTLLDKIDIEKLAIFEAITNSIAVVFVKLEEIDIKKLDILSTITNSFASIFIQIEKMDVEKLTIFGSIMSSIQSLFTSLEKIDIKKLLILGFVASAITSLFAVLSIVSVEKLSALGLITDSINKTFDTLNKVDVGKLFAIGPALASVGMGLASLGAGEVIEAIGSFLGGDPIEKIERLAKAGDGLMKTSTALQGVAGALTQVSTALNALDISKLEKIAEMSSGGGITGFLNNVFDKITSVVGGNESTSPTAGSPIGSSSVTTNPISTPSSTTNTNTSSISSNTTSTNIQPGIDLTPMIAAINEVKASIDKLYGKNSTINMDGTKVGTTLTQGSYRVA